MSIVLKNEPCLMPLMFRSLIKKSDHVRPTYIPIYTSMQNDLLRLYVLSRVQKGGGYWYYDKHVSSHTMLCPPQDCDSIYDHKHHIVYKLKTLMSKPFKSQ